MKTRAVVAGLAAALFLWSVLALLLECSYDCAF